MSKIKILQVHNYYTQPGGEDTVFESDVALLRQRGHEVITYIENNERVNAIPPASLALQTIYSQYSYRKISDLLLAEKPDVVHFHNTFPLISPAAYYACRRFCVPVIQSLHNPRLMCPAGSFYRNEQNCIECLDRPFAYPGILHACYRHSRSQTSVVAAMSSIHRLFHTWTKMVDTYIVASRFYCELFIRAGLPEEKIVFKPHFVEPGISFDPDRKPGGYALFIGRLDPEKGVRTLLQAWKQAGIPLKIRGSGQMEEEVRQFIGQNSANNLELVGRLSRIELSRLMEGARFLVWPTESYYETFGFVAVESFALGLPVIGAGIGVNAEMVKDGETGLHFTPGNSADLASKMEWAWQHPDEMGRMGRNARREYEEKYTPERNYDLLMDIYRRAIEMKRDQAN